MTFTVPNLISLLRLGLVPLFIHAMVNGNWRRALLIFLIASVSDGLDGLIARFWHQQSLLGAYLDPLADKLLLTSAYVVLSIPSLNRGAEIPLWVTLLVVARDVLIVVMSLVFYLAAGIRKFPPTALSKVNTTFQLVAVILVLISGTLPERELVKLVADTTLLLVACLTVASSLDYIHRFGRLGQEEG